MPVKHGNKIIDSTEITLKKSVFVKGIQSLQNINPGRV
jgi:hypothetical protein